MAQVAELVSSQNSSLRVLFCFAYLDQLFIRTNHINLFFLTVFLTAIFFFDTYFDATAMTRNMQLFIWA